jgi:hypothetical protein
VAGAHPITRHQKDADDEPPRGIQPQQRPGPQRGAGAGKYKAERDCNEEADGKEE